ncbi:MAG TPA: mycofactocin biosynthesis glycosyltransferase MftF [Acidimicrobiales bacterium]|nr:mycofactocin biosynthesis glycosyltransferase MftF [Acidimicrobiales bacterium]
MTPLPPGWRLVIDPSVRTLDGGDALVGGYPGRLLRLSGSGRAALAGLIAGSRGSVAARRLGRRLVDAGMAHPRPPGGHDVADVTVVIPVKDRADLLERCLDAVGPEVPVVVVDDGSARPGPIAEVCRRHRARLVVRGQSGGPAVARNDALAEVRSELIAFLDSDCVPQPNWLAELVGLFGDPEIGAVAPRVRPMARSGTGRPTVLDRYGSARSPLDLGPREGEVGPGRPVSYVPTAALVVRRSALGAGFAPTLRYGEDVDLIWSMGDAGWHTRYVPSVTVDHAEPRTWLGLLGRRYHYGTSAAPLARRHPGRLAPAVVRPLPVAAVALALSRRPLSAAALAILSGLALGRRAAKAGIPSDLVARWSGEALAATAESLGRAGTVIAGPVLVAAVATSRRYRWSALALLVAPTLGEWLRRRPPLDPLRWSAVSLADDFAYGLGVWRGCLRERTFSPLIPSIRPIR